MLLKEILISNHYPGWLIDQTFSKRRKKFLEFSDNIPETTEKKDIFILYHMFQVSVKNLKEFYKIMA